MSGNPEGLAWEAVQRDGDAVLPDGWADLTPDERDTFRDELEDWMSKAEAQPQLFADQGARAAHLHALTVPPGDAVGWAFVRP
ncbi:hypothetical protein [Blastococcus sp. CT_GayMR16]|uniref:hypothetical protein n=1 Tax=Blastococcus sp. CT_GayMR16 TaxID=2559607 RepID=UPI001073E74D|nr:hypothetical protein [Blastococcus sp. CT_GayMR16]TFV90406.1 hypothetical protein E4P38_02910 [Blastococcus sp. CT_GayMR16]